MEGGSPGGIDGEEGLLKGQQLKGYCNHLGRLASWGHTSDDSRVDGVGWPRVVVGGEPYPDN